MIAAMYAVEGRFSMAELEVPAPGDTLGTSGVTVSLAYATDADPLFTIHCTEYSNCPEEGQVIHIPAGLKPQDGYNVGGEGHTVVINVSQAREDGFYHLRSIVPRVGGTLDVGYGGPCHFTDYANGGACSEGQTAGNIPLGGLLIRPDELLAATAAKGDLGHALYITTCVSKGAQRWPATSGNGNGNSACAPMGSRIVLRKTDAQIAALNVPEWTRVIYRTLAHYGMMSDDNNNYTVWTFASEDDNGRTSLGLPAAWPAAIAMIAGDATAYHVDLSIAAGSYHIVLPVDSLKQSDMAVLADTGPMPNPSPSPSPASLGIGAYVNPIQVTGMPTTVSSLAQALGKPLAYELFYAGPTTSVAGMLTAASAHGTIPILSIKSLVTADMLSGKLDAGMDAVNTQIRAYGKPVYVRFDWEFNLPAKHLSPADFQAQWARYFAHLSASNVVRYWCGSGGAPTTMAAYYITKPPLSQVDGWDKYDNRGLGFVATQATPYGVVAPFGKPLLIGETGCVTNQGTTCFPASRASVAEVFSGVIGLNYFDSKQYALTPAGLAAFKAFAASP